TGRGTPKADLIANVLLGQDFALSNGTLTVYGDQLGGGYNDTVTLDVTGSGGVQVALNGETVRYAPGAVTGVKIIARGGVNTVNVEATLTGVPVSIDMRGGIGTVNISPAAQNLDNIRGDLVVTGGNTDDVLFIYDRNDRSQDIYSVSAATVSRNDA